MKTVLIAIVCFCGSNLSYAQNTISIKLYVQDNLGRTDSATFGLNDSSTIGIDTQLGEANIFGASSDTLDIRVIQRDSLNFNCIQVHPWTASPNLYFPDNIDSKVDYRPFLFDFQSLNVNFEIKVKSMNYPVVVAADFNELAWHFLEGWSSIHLLDSNCVSVEYQSMEHSFSFDTLFVLTDSTFNTLVARFEHEVGVEKNANEADIQIFPNPTGDDVSIKSKSRNITTVFVLNALGQTVLTQQTGRNTFTTNISLQSLPAGIYQLGVRSHQGLIFTQKVVKTD